MKTNHETNNSGLGSQPAYPSTKTKNYPNHTGITRREYFAAKAMQGYLANGCAVFAADTLAKDCYAIADAMLELGSAE